MRACITGLGLPLRTSRHRRTCSPPSYSHFFSILSHSGSLLHCSSLFLLVTDLGYLSEGNVVWERLDTVDGDTQLCGPDFKPYVAPPPVARDVALALDGE